MNETIRHFFEIPLIGPISTQVTSVICLYIIILCGMLAKAIWDQTEVGKVWPDTPNLVRPLVISPFVVAAFVGIGYIPDKELNMSVTTLLYAFQVGFMWQHVLRKRLDVPK